MAKKVAILAQLVEQFTRNEQVVGSSPMDGSKHKTLFFTLPADKTGIVLLFG